MKKPFPKAPSAQKAPGEKGRAPSSPGAAITVLFDALVLPDGEEAVTRLAKDGLVIDFLKDQYRHGKTIWVGAASAQLLDIAGVAQKLSSGDADPGLILGSPAQLGDQISEFIAALGKHRHPGREEQNASQGPTARRR